MVGALGWFAIATACELFILDGDETFVDDRSAAVETAAGKELVVVKVAVRKTVFLVESYVLEPLRTMRTDKAGWVEGTVDRMNHLAGNVLATAKALCAATN